MINFNKVKNIKSDYPMIVAENLMILSCMAEID